jgi:hypothetical protein
VEVQAVLAISGILMVVFVGIAAPVVTAAGVAARSLF